MTIVKSTYQTVYYYSVDIFSHILDYNRVSNDILELEINKSQNFHNMLVSCRIPVSRCFTPYP